MTTIEALKYAAARIDEMENISAGHITITPHVARFTLYRQVGEQLMHVQYDVMWEELDLFQADSQILCDTILNSLVRRLNGEEVTDPCGG